MQVWKKTTAALGLALLTPVLMAATQEQEADRKVSGGGITAPGWMGQVDARPASQGMSIKDSKFEKTADGFHLTVGPAAYYWNPANKAAGNYTVKATFKEPKQDFSHAHPMGLFIGGNNLGSGQQTLLYCTAYRNGNYIVNMFRGDTVTQLVKRTPNDAVHKAAAPTDPVTQEIAWVVKDGRAECMINGTMVAGFDKADIVGADKLETTDGIYGIRVSHNMELSVSNLTMTKN